MRRRGRRNSTLKGQSRDQIDRPGSPWIERLAAGLALMSEEVENQLGMLDLRRLRVHSDGIDGDRSWNSSGIASSTFKQWGLIESGVSDGVSRTFSFGARNPGVLRAHFTLRENECRPVFVARRRRDGRWHVRAKTPAYIYPAPSLRRLSLPARRSERRALLLFSNRQRCGYPV